jgi:aminoglycoside phosphotransferase (APT) family kinase protein
MIAARFGDWDRAPVTSESAFSVILARRSQSMTNDARNHDMENDHMSSTGTVAVTIDSALVRRLVDSQFPQWAHLPIEPVVFGGWDNRTFHLGDGMSVRLPRAEAYVAQVAKEQRWLPRLAPHLPLPIPLPLAMGEPTKEYPWPWSIYRWLDGEPASIARIIDLNRFATDMARFLMALHQVDPTNGPSPRPHDFQRGGPLPTYDRDTRHAITILDGRIDTAAATDVWRAALASSWRGSPVWVHGDLTTGNLLVKNGQLSAVIDFGTSGVGDPACDLTIAWTLFDAASRDAFRAQLPLDDTAWARGRGWALWKALITVVDHQDTDPVQADRARQIIDAVIADHRHAQ